MRKARRFDIKTKAPILISVVSLILSAATLAYTVFYDWHKGHEALLVHVEARSGNYFTDLLGYEGPKPSILVLESVGIVSNVGVVPVSIMNYELYSLGPGKYQYLLMDQGLYDSSGLRLSFPLALEPGKSVSFVVRTGVPISEAASKALAETFRSGSRSTLEAVAARLLGQGMNLLGQRMVSVPHADGTSGMIDDSGAPTPMFSLELRSAREGRFEATFCPVQFLGAF